MSPGRCHLSTLSTSPSSVPLRVSQLTNLQVLTELQGLAWAVEKDLVGEFIIKLEDLVGEFIIKLVEFRPGPWTGGLRHTAAAEWLGEDVADYLSQYFRNKYDTRNVYHLALLTLTGVSLYH